MMAGAAVTRTEKSVRMGVRMARRSWCLLMLSRETHVFRLINIQPNVGKTACGHMEIISAIRASTLYMCTVPYSV